MAEPYGFTSFDIAALAISTTVFVGYHVHLYCFAETLPFSVNMKNSQLWIQKHHDAADSPTSTLAIQTLRNTMVAAVFIAGNAISFAYNLTDDYHTLTTTRDRIRALIVASLMFSSFLCFSNVIRLASMLGYLIGTMQIAEKRKKELEERERKDMELREAQERERAANNQTSEVDVLGNGMVEVEPTQSNPNNSEIIFRPKSSPNAMSGYAYMRTNKNEQEEIKSPRRLIDEVPEVYEESELMMTMIIIYFSFGFRLMFVSIPFAFYSAGPAALLVSTILVFAFLYSYDGTKHGMFRPPRMWEPDNITLRQKTTNK